MNRARNQRPADDTAERVCIDCRIISITDKSVTIDAFGRKPMRVTLPWGQVRTDHGGFSIPEWLARDRGLI